MSPNALPWFRASSFLILGAILCDRACRAIDVDDMRVSFEVRLRTDPFPNNFVLWPEHEVSGDNRSGSIAQAVLSDVGDGCCSPVGFLFVAQ